MAILLADSARVLEISRPSETERSHLEVAVSEHVSEAEGIVVFFREDLEELLDSVVVGEPVRLVLQRLHSVHFDPLDHEANIVGFAILVEVRGFVDGVDPLDVTSHHLDTRFFSAVFLEEEVVCLQVQHTGCLLGIDCGPFMEVTRIVIRKIVVDHGIRNSGKADDLRIDRIRLLAAVGVLVCVLWTDKYRLVVQNDLVGVLGCGILDGSGSSVVHLRRLRGFREMDRVAVGIAVGWFLGLEVEFPEFVEAVRAEVVHDIFDG